MPELPEVETVRRTLKRLILGKEIEKIDVFYEKILINQTPLSFNKILMHQSIHEINRYGKYLIFHIGKYKLIVHLRMEGKFYIKPVSEIRNKHEHVIFHFTDGTTLRYHDTRKFGTMELLAEKEESSSGLKTIGLEPFEKGFTFSYLKEKIHSKARAIKTVLLDQHIVAGLGNIYVDEVLFLSQIHPSRLAKNLSDGEIKRIIKNSQDVLTKAIDLGGSTIRSYTSSLGVTGRFQNELFIHMRQGEPCKVCGTIIEKTRVGGRGTYYCPHCQRK